MQSLRAQIKRNTPLKKLQKKTNKQKTPKTSNNLNAIQISRYKKTVRSKNLIKKAHKEYLKKIPTIKYSTMKQKKWLRL